MAYELALSFEKPMTRGTKNSQFLRRPAEYEKNHNNLDYSANIHSSPLLEGRIDFPALWILGDFFGPSAISRTDTAKT